MSAIDFLRHLPEAAARRRPEAPFRRCDVQPGMQAAVWRARRKIRRDGGVPFVSVTRDGSGGLVELRASCESW